MYENMTMGMLGVSTDVVVDVVVLFSAVNLVLLTVLINIYIRGYKEIKSKFTLGLVSFAFLLTLQNVSSIIFIFNIEQMHGHGMGFPLLLPTVLQTAGLVVLLLITWE
jgi:hypothetical protein